MEKFFQWIEDEFSQFLKFAVTGVINTGVDFFVFFALCYFGWWEYLAQIVAYSCGMVNSYILNRSWTFKSKQKFFSAAMIKFMAVNLIVLLLSLGLLWFFMNELNFSRLVAKILTTMVTMIVGFLLNKLLVFSK